MQIPGPRTSTRLPHSQKIITHLQVSYQDEIGKSEVTELPILIYYIVLPDQTHLCFFSTNMGPYLDSVVVNRFFIQYRSQERFTYYKFCSNKIRSQTFKNFNIAYQGVLKNISNIKNKYPRGHFKFQIYPGVVTTAGIFQGIKINFCEIVLPNGTMFQFIPSTVSTYCFNHKINQNVTPFLFRESPVYPRELSDYKINSNPVKVVSYLQNGAILQGYAHQEVYLDRFFKPVYSSSFLPFQNIYSLHFLISNLGSIFSSFLFSLNKGSISFIFTSSHVFSLSHICLFFEKSFNLN